jgi:uncharacterized protein (TIGR03435 family)
VKAIAVLAVAMVVAFQTAPGAQAPRAFEVASIKRNTGSLGGMPLVAITGQRVSAPFVTVRTLVQVAYGVDRDQVAGGPGWIDSDRFEVNATAPAGATTAEVRGMLRTLLAERFGLTAHSEKRDLPVNVLTFGGQFGPKMRPAGPQCAPGTIPPGLPPPPPPPPPTPAGAAEMIVLGASPAGSKCGALVMNGFISGREMKMEAIAWMLSQLVRRPVLDRTGLGETYDFDLMYLPDVGPPQVNGTAIAWDAPALATAIREQLGLKFDSTRAPVQVVVVDRVTAPTEN